MTRQLRILMLEDRPADADLVMRELRKAGIQFAGKPVSTEADFLAQLRDEPPDLILADYSLPAYDGLAALAAARRELPEAPFIFVSGSLGEEAAIEALHCGATDYVFKERLARLGPAVRRAVREIKERAQRRQAEESLRRSEEYFRALTENAMDITAVLDPDSTIRYLSPSVQRVFGYAPEELVGQNPFELIHPEDVARIRELFRAAVATPGATVRADFRFRHKDGSWRALEGVTRNQLHDPCVNGVIVNCRDVTARMGAEGRLRLLSGAVESAANAIVITDREGVIVWVNRAFTQLTGYALQEVQGRKTSLLKSGVHEEAFYRNLWETVLAGRVWSAEMTNRRKDGTLFTEENTITPVRDEKGEVAHFVAVKQDVTERNRATEALRMSDSLYQSLVENVPQHIFRKDVAGRFTFGNGPFCKALGKPLADILGKTDLDFSPPELAAKYRQDDLRVLQTGQPFEGEETFQQANGESVTVNVLKTPLRDLTGQIVGLQGISWDITERRLAQEARRESEDNYRALIELSPNAIFLHCEEKFVYANPATLKLLGADQPEQLLGRSVFDIVPPENHDTIHRRIRHAGAGGLTPPLDQRILRLDGAAVEVEGTSIPFTFKGKPAVQTIMRDITERKQLEQQLRQAQKLEAVGQLAGGVAHDFNNVLAVIRGNAELLLMEADNHTPGTEDCLKQITAASERAANLTRQLLTFSRKQVMQSRPLILNEVIKDLTKMLKRVIGEQIDLQCCYGGQLPFVQADAGMIEQALVNLAINARDAMPRGGQLLISSEAVRFDEGHPHTHPKARAGQFVCLTVKDAGTGIAPEHLPRIFEPFFTTKELGKGTGLGLATVYGIVQQHQGWIEVISQPGAGTTFKIFLPGIPPPAVAAAPPHAEANPPGGSETILLVEDDYAVRMITRRVLECHGYKIYEATTAMEALDVWRSRAEGIALLLTDIVMPQGITGRDLAEQLRASRPTLKVVLMSGYSADVVGKDTEFFQQTQSYFLQKPCSARTLLETVRSCLDGK